MDFKTLGENSPVYIIRKKPFRYEVGTLKSKGTKPVNQFQVTPQNTPPLIDVVLTVSGNDEILPNVPQGLETIDYKGSYYSTTTEGILQALANLMQMASNGKAEQAYYDTVLTEGEKVRELLDMPYAENKRQARTIKALEERQDVQDKKLDKILSRLDEFFSPPKK